MDLTGWRFGQTLENIKVYVASNTKQKDLFYIREELLIDLIEEYTKAVRESRDMGLG